VPYKVAKRISEAIRMSVQVDGRAPLIVIDESTSTTVSIDKDTKNLLDKFDKFKVDNFWNVK
jgi:hypothetical protein